MHYDISLVHVVLLDADPVRNQSKSDIGMAMNKKQVSEEIEEGSDKNSISTLKGVAMVAGVAIAGVMFNAPDSSKAITPKLEGALPATASSMASQAPVPAVNCKSGQTIDLSGVEVSSSVDSVMDICSVAAQSEQRFRESTLASIEEGFCEVAQLGANNFGNGSYNNAITRLEGWEQSKDVQGMLHALKACSSEEYQKLMVEKMLAGSDISIYSIGTFYFGEREQTCIGYLQHLSASGVEYGYELHGIGECSLFEPAVVVHHPVNSPDAIFAGDYFAETLGYDGKMPETTVYKGHSSAFYTGVEVKAPVLSAANPAMIQPEGKWLCDSEPDYVDADGQDLFRYTFEGGQFVQSFRSLNTKGDWIQSGQNIEFHATSEVDWDESYPVDYNWSARIIDQEDDGFKMLAHPLERTHSDHLYNDFTCERS